MIARPALALALLALVACRREPVDTRAITPLVPRGSSALDAGAARPASGSRPRRGVRYIADRPAPDGALGARWGMTRAALLEAHRAAGGECRDSREYVFCRRALAPVPLPVVVTYEFCGEGLCSVAIDVAATRDEAQLSAHFDQLYGMVVRTLGPPSDEARTVGPGCAGHLALCLASRQAELTARWAWRAGPHVQLSVDQDEEDAFRALASVTWLSAERARRQEAADESGLADAGAPPDR
jgi:hypothetical protein